MMHRHGFTYHSIIWQIAERNILCFYVFLVPNAYGRAWVEALAYRFIWVHVFCKGYRLWLYYFTDPCNRKVTDYNNAKNKHRRPPVTLWMSKRVAYNKSYRTLTFAKRTVTIYYNATCSWFWCCWMGKVLKFFCLSCWEDVAGYKTRGKKMLWL